MYKAFGVSVFLLGSMGLLYQQWYARQQRMQFLQEMQTCLLRMQQAVLKRNLPVMAVLAMESERKVTGFVLILPRFACVFCYIIKKQWKRFCRKN